MSLQDMLAVRQFSTGSMLADTLAVRTQNRTPRLAAPKPL